MWQRSLKPARVSQRWIIPMVLGIGAIALGSCRSPRPDRASYDSAHTGEAGTSSEDPGFVLADGGAAPPPALDAPGLCGNQMIGQIVDKPNLYFIVDRSGSMAEAAEDDTTSKYDSLRLAMRDVLKQVGHRVRYGAAAFPSSSSDCGAGVEVLAMGEGDAVTYALQGELGPRLTELLAILGRFDTSGSTPIAATLEVLTPILQDLPGRTYAILATDGEPNCGAVDYCEPHECSLVRDGYSLPNGMVCSASLNCCDPDVLANGPAFCLDESTSTTHLRALAQSGIHTFVVGLPGAPASSATLTAMAAAGDAGGDSLDTARYYPVSDTANLVDTLREITASVAISCEIELETEPPAQSLVNLYFDGIIIPSDPEDGWELVDSQTIQVRGAACERLTIGDVYQVQIVAGCPTVVL